MSNLILRFSEIPKIFIFVRLRQLFFLSGDWKKLPFWSSAFFVVSALEMREWEAYKKQTGSNVSVVLNNVSTLEHDRFR